MSHDTTTLAGKIAVMQAAENGAEIEVTPVGLADWKPIAKPKWDWASCDYRIKPREPKVIWVNEYAGGKMVFASEVAAKDAAKQAVTLAYSIAVKYIEVLEETK